MATGDLRSVLNYHEIKTMINGMAKRISILEEKVKVLEQKE